MSTGPIARAALARLVLGAALALAGIAPVGAQPYPSKPIRIIVPFPAGGIASWAPIVKASGARAD